MRGFWLLVHVLGFTLWLGGGIATMVAGVTAKRMGAAERLTDETDWYQAVEQNAAEVMKRATIHFDGGGQSPGPVTAACTVALSDGSFDQDVTRFDQGPTTPRSGKR